MWHHVQVACWDGAVITFGLGWFQTSIVPITAFWVARITGVGHHAQPWTMNYEALFKINWKNFTFVSLWLHTCWKPKLLNNTWFLLQCILWCTFIFLCYGLIPLSIIKRYYMYLFIMYLLFGADFEDSN
jgi:hypothetical protein